LKRIPIVLLAFLAAFCLAACSNEAAAKNLTVNCISSQNKEGFDSRYDLFTGTREYTCKVKSNAKIAVQVDIVTEDGNLSLVIAKEGDEPAYTGQDLSTSSFTVYLTDPGNYTIRFKGEKHKGSYAVAYINE